MKEIDVTKLTMHELIKWHRNAVIYSHENSYLHKTAGYAVG